MPRPAASVIRRPFPNDVRAVFATAHDVAPEWHVRMQAAFQKYTDNAVSKTVNLPNESTREDVRRVYDLAYELGCKGVTIYRDGSKANQVLSVPAGKKGTGPEPPAAVRGRPDTLTGFTTRIKTGLGNLYITVTEHRGRPFEVFATIGKSGRSTTAKTEAIGRLVSLALRSGIEVSQIVAQLKGIGGRAPGLSGRRAGPSPFPTPSPGCWKKRYMAEGDGRQVAKGLMGGTCPECGQTISYEEGCQTCHFCGFTKCG